MIESVCERCGKENVATIMSIFNTQHICRECKIAEREHPAYAAAADAERKAVQQGDHNFPGVGCPPDLLRRKEKR